MFEPFGELEFVQLQKEEHTGRSKGYGFVQYAVRPAVFSPGADIAAGTTTRLRLKRL